ncbi:MAG: hypothetical protein HY318_06075, partial [Armatimonadetes bacterium]|nr:hypothetical protein [Armatimonadota bacterium]
MDSTIGARRTLWPLFLLMAAVNADPPRFSDTFDGPPNYNWTGVPSQAKLSDRILTLPGENGGTRMTSRDKFRYSRYTVKLKLTGLAPGNYAYFGFMSREPWGAHGCMVILDGGRFRLQVRRDGGKVAEPFETPPVTSEVWHTLTLDWKPDFVEMMWDGKSCGRFEERERIPDIYITSFLDVVQTGAPRLEAQIDSVEIEGGEMRVADRSGLGPRPPVRTPPDTKRIAWPIRKAPSVSVTKTSALLENAFYQAELKWENGLHLAQLRNKATNSACLVIGQESQLFTIAGEERLVRSSDFFVSEASSLTSQREKSLRLRLSDARGNWEAVLTFHVDASPEIRMGLELMNLGKGDRKAAICWPHLTGLQMGEKASGNYYLFPWKGGWCNNRPMELATAYGQSTGLLQLFTLFNPEQGGSVYTYLKDDSGRIKTIVMRKVDRPDTEVSSYAPLYDEDRPEKGVVSDTVGTQVLFRNLPVTIARGGRRTLPEVVLAVSPGDWRQAFRSYASWAHLWMKDPRVPDWYKGIFQTLAVHDEAGNTGFEHGFLRNDQWALAEQAKPGDGLLEVPY